MVNSVAAWASSRHLRRLNHSRFAYQSWPSGGLSASRAGRITARSLLVHRTITG